MDNGLTPSEFTSYQRSLALGSLMGQGKDGGEPTEEEWHSKLNERRTRIRGIRIEQREDGSKKVVAMGQKIYLPNIIFRMVRNFTPPGKPYNPYEATFRIPQSLTKTDIRSYLLSVYGVETTYIRTDNYLSPIFRDRRNVRVTKPHKTYKRTVVGLVEPFAPPLAMEELPNVEMRESQQKYLEEAFHLQEQKDGRKKAFLRMTRKGSENWKWRNLTTTNRGQILKAIGEKRWRRQSELEAVKTLMDEARAEGRPVDKLDRKQVEKIAAKERARITDEVLHPDT